MIYKIVHSFHYKKNELLRRVFGLPLYMRSIAAFSMTAAIGTVFSASYSGGTKNRRNRPVLAAVIELLRRSKNPAAIGILFAAGWTTTIDL